MNTRASFQSDNMAFPLGGTLCLPMLLDFSASARVELDLGVERQRNIIDFIQSVFVDNADGTAPLDLTIYGGPRPQRIRVPAYGQGIFPVNLPVGQQARIRVDGTQGIDIDVIFYNVAFPYMVWGPADGVLVTPPLTVSNLDIEPLVIGDNVIVAAIAGETVKLYRLMLTVGGAATLKFTDGPAGTVLFSTYLFAGGSITMQASGVPWVTTSAGKSLVLTSDAAVNCYGGFGFVQS